MKAILVVLFFSTVYYTQIKYDYRNDSLFVVYGEDQYFGQKDCNAQCDLTSDGDNIIINVSVKDDSLIFNNSIYSDHIELWLGYPDMFQYGFVYGKSGNKYAYIIGNDKYLYQYQEKPYLKSLKEEIKNPYIHDDQGGSFSKNYNDISDDSWGGEWIKKEVDEYLSSVRKDSLSKISVFFGLTHFGINPMNDSVYFYDRENYSYLEKFLNLKIGDLNNYIQVKSTVKQDGYQAKIIVKPEALGFVHREGVTGINFLIDVVDCDEKGKQSTLLSTSQKRKWADVDSFNRVRLKKYSDVNIDPDFPFLGEKSSLTFDREIKYLFPDTYMFTTEGWVGIQGISDNFNLFDHPTYYSLPNIQRYYFTKVDLKKTTVQVGTKNLNGFNIGNASYVQLNEKTIYNKGVLIDIFKLPSNEIAAIVCVNNWGGGRYTRWDTSRLWLVKENNDNILIGNSEEGHFKFSDSLAVNNYILNEYAMSYEDYPWKENIELNTSENTMIINIEESKVKVQWNYDGTELIYNLLQGENVSKNER